MGVGIPPWTFVIPRVQPPRLSKFPKKGLVWTLQADCVPHLGHLVFWLTFSVPPDTGPVWWQWSRLTVSLFLLWSGGADTTFHINRLFTPDQQPARCSIYRAIVIREMSDPWPDMMTKFIISPAKSSTDNRLLRDMIREGCLAVAWDTVMSHHQDPWPV